MGVKNVLIEGVSGSGKTTVAEELERLGYHVIHGDRVLAYVGDPATGAAPNKPEFSSEAQAVAWLNKHWIWPVDKVEMLAADHGHPVIFFCGGSRNFHQFLHVFDKLFVLAVDFETLKRRLASRPEDEFGGRPVEQALIARLHATQEDVPKNAMRINSAVPIGAVVDDILGKL